MGASSSVPFNKNIHLKDNTYISYADKDACAEILYNELINAGLNVIQGRFLCETNTVNSTELFVDNVLKIMYESDYIIICVSEKTVNSFHQAVEINEALDSKKNIIYVFTDINFTPISTPYLNGLVCDNKWLPAYNELTLNSTLDEIISLI